MTSFIGMIPAFFFLSFCPYSPRPSEPSSVSSYFFSAFTRSLSLSFFCLSHFSQSTHLSFYPPSMVSHPPGGPRCHFGPLLLNLITNGIVFTQPSSSSDTHVPTNTHSHSTPVHAASQITAGNNTKN